MDPIEQAIRNAFAKGDPEDSAFRERVYRSAQSALERALQANSALSDEAVKKRRDNLLAVVASIETEFVRASEPVAAPPREAEVRRAPAVESVAPPAATAAAAGRREPDFGDAPAPGDDLGFSPAARPEVRIDTPRAPRKRAPAADEGGAPEPRRRRGRDGERGRRTPWGLIVGLVTFLIVIGLAFWIAAEMGFIGAVTRNAAEQSRQQNGSGTQGDPGADANALESWMPVFEPRDPTTVSASAGARAEVTESGGDNVLRLTSGRSGAVVRFDIGAGVLERLAGKRAVFDIMARGADGQETQMSVTCNLHDVADCGRNRYLVGTENSEYLFEVDVPQGAETGTIEIVSDISNEGRSVDIVQIRVTTAPQAD